MKRPPKCKVHPGYSGADYYPGEQCSGCLKLYNFHHQPPEDEKGRRTCCKEAISSTIDQCNKEHQVEKEQMIRVYNLERDKHSKEVVHLRARIGNMRMLVKSLCKEIGRDT